MEQESELKDYEFGHYAFETLPKAKGTPVGETLALVDGVDICEINISEKDPKIRSLHEKVHGGLYKEFYFIENDILYRSVMDNGHKFSAAVVPEDLTDTVLVLGHNQSGHNCYQRTYAAIKWSYYWKGMRKHILVHCKTCVTCAKQKIQKTLFKKQIFEPGVQPMEFMCIDLIGEFHPPSSKGNRYTLTAVCILTGFTFNPFQE